MHIGMVGLGRMGMNMAVRLMKGEHTVAAFDRDIDAVNRADAEGIKGETTLEGLADWLPAPRTLWLMLPAGRPVDETVERLAELLEPGDTVIDGGNSFYKDALRHTEVLDAKGIYFMDVGVSGGVWGLTAGYCLMAGGDREVYDRHVPIFETLSPRDGYLYCGPAGAGHFVKMVHNGIEYGMMAAYGEGFNILHASPYGAGLDMSRVSHLWNQGSVVRSWLLELAEDAFRRDPGLPTLKPYVDDSGEGRWTLQQAVDTAVPAPVIAAALFQRFASRGGGDFSDKLLAALRNEFGGHAVKKEE
ncbi:MAG: decarboxylating 6-phosphogluconate dehydrogenase [Nitrospirae bacterium]|nr:decarboxylating 6-phosphogluconate dehydrogenase [Nitrospirota bacterium]